jgi:hypothetical protein
MLCWRIACLQARPACRGPTSHTSTGYTKKTGVGLAWFFWCTSAGIDSMPYYRWYGWYVFGALAWLVNKLCASVPHIRPMRWGGINAPYALAWLVGDLPGWHLAYYLPASMYAQCQAGSTFRRFYSIYWVYMLGTFFMMTYHNK